MLFVKKKIMKIEIHVGDNVMMAKIRHLNSHGDECNIAVWWLLIGVVTFRRRINCIAVLISNERKEESQAQVPFSHVWMVSHYLAASRSFIDKFVVDSSDLIELLLLLLLLLIWLVLWLLLLLCVLFISLPPWWWTIELSGVWWPTDVVIDVMFKSVIRSTVFSDSYVTVRRWEKWASHEIYWMVSVV